MAKKSRAFTPEEARAQFLHQLKHLAEYWAALPDHTPAQKCDGVVFSTLVLFDGESGGFPALDIRLAPHPDDKAFSISEGENWYETNQLINDTSLHDEYVQMEHKHG